MCWTFDRNKTANYHVGIYIVLDKGRAVAATVLEKGGGTLAPNFRILA